ncbi:Alpha beta hydrolase fold-5 protein [Pleurostoma richardsiae]|uniref:Alpha beta hydrolase fold-5 protein n=1 Tax=Pleurostoma richardsiae TaxID=41990 RepID=A0AA38VV09_9PEZI|nr:Alpha beta hydrolase fold-5 protein [Pleurostoma richardsiae]
MSRRQEVPVESSWRMVEGEHDSFDTSIVPDDDGFVISSGPSQLSSGSQGNWSVGSSQDHSTIQDFVNKADEEQVILKSPFQPTVPGAVRRSPRESVKHRSPDPEFYMPTVEVESPRRSSATSSRTVRPVGRQILRRRQVNNDDDSPTKRRRGEHWDARKGWGPGTDESPGVAERLARSLPGAVFDILGWFFGVVGLALRYAQKPLAICLAIYLCFGGLIIAQNMATKSLYASLSPVCRIPGASFLDLPFCPKMPGVPKGDEPTEKPVEFAGLMDVQDKFEEVLEKSANGVSLPMEMKRSEAAIRDLRTLVRHSALQGRDELVLEFDGYVDTAKTASNGLQRFNTHVGSAVDSVISINRWTSRYLDGLVAAEEQAHGWLEDFTSWVFAPFQPAVFSEHNLRDKYIEHTALVSDKIGGLILEAQAVLLSLEKAEGHLGLIYEFVTRAEKSVQADKHEILWTLWTLVGRNSRQLRSLDGQLSLLARVNAQRTDAVAQVSELIVELEKIQAGLDDLRERVAEPGLMRGVSGPGGDMPLSVHIETINRGVERLEQARSRIRAIEDDRIRQVLARGREEERLIDSA